MSTRRRLPFCMIPEFVYKSVEKGDLEPIDVLLFCRLDRYADKERQCDPSRKTLATALRVSANTVDRALGRLRLVGAVTWHPCFVPARGTGKLRQTSNEYVLATQYPFDWSDPAETNSAEDFGDDPLPTGGEGPPGTRGDPPLPTGGAPRTRARKEREPGKNESYLRDYAATVASDDGGRGGTSVFDDPGSQPCAVDEQQRVEGHERASREPRNDFERDVADLAGWFERTAVARGVDRDVFDEIRYRCETFWARRDRPDVDALAAIGAVVRVVDAEVCDVGGTELEAALERVLDRLVAASTGRLPEEQVPRWPSKLGMIVARLLTACDGRDGTDVNEAALAALDELFRRDR